MDWTLESEPQRAWGGCKTLQSTPSWSKQTISTRATHWLLLGEAEGDTVGKAVGIPVGSSVGSCVGCGVGLKVGRYVGLSVGSHAVSFDRPQFGKSYIHVDPLTPSYRGHGRGTYLGDTWACR